MDNIQESVLTEVNGYSLFNELEDSALKARNRAVCLFNTMESQATDKKLKGKGVLSMVQYMQAIPVNERAAVLREFEELAHKEGWK